MISYEKYPMPTDWEMKYDFATKTSFFVNHKTKTTTWEDPRKAIFEKDDSNAHFIHRNDFMDDDEDLSAIIKVLNNEDTFDTFVRKLKEKYPTISNDIIKEVFKKSKGNYSNAEVLLRQETRKEKNSTLSSSTINYRPRNSDDKSNDNTESRFNLTERSTYKAPETSKDRIKFQLRLEFSDVDIRIVDRVLEITNYSLEESRKIILKTETEQEKEIPEMPQKKGSKVFAKVKDFRSHNLKEVQVNPLAKEVPQMDKRSLATGANPKNVKGSKVKAEYKT